MHRYFVTYIFASPRGTGNGWCEVIRPDPIRGGQDITALTQQFTAETNATSLTITGYQRFED